MQIHILGGGAIGQLLAFHLTQTLRATAATLRAGSSGTSRPVPAYLLPYLPSPQHSGTTVHIRNPATAQRLNDAGGVVTLERSGVKRAIDGIVVQGGLGATPGAAPALPPKSTRIARPTPVWKYERRMSARHALKTHELLPQDVNRAGVSLFEPRSSNHAHIDALFLCTKADTASFALESLVPRLSRRSTLVLTQNGLGLADILIAKHFPDPANRPFIVLSSLTHGLYRAREDGLRSVHASLGEIHFGVVPDLRFAPLEGGLEQRAPWTDSDERIPPTLQTKWPPDTLTLEHIQRHFAGPSQMNSIASHDPALGQPAHEASSLVHTIALLLGAEELKASWIPMPDFHRKALRKLAINACINPLTAILECQNGALLSIPAKDARLDQDGGERSEAERERGQECEGIMREVCEEISAVIQERAERSWWAAKHRQEDSDAPDAPAGWSASDVLVPGLHADTLGADLLPQGLVAQDAPVAEDAPPPLHPMLTADGLFEEVLRVLPLVKDNYSSMYQDVVLHGRASSEISFVNGYVRRLADTLNAERAAVLASSAVDGDSSGRSRRMKQVHTPVNRMLERMVVAKCDLFGSLDRRRTEAGDDRPYKPSRRLSRAAPGGQADADATKAPFNPSPSFMSFKGPEEAAEKVAKSFQFDLSRVRVPKRERVGYRKSRAGGYGRLWEFRNLVMTFRSREQKRWAELLEAHDRDEGLARRPDDDDQGEGSGTADGGLRGSEDGFDRERDAAEGTAGHSLR